MNEPAMVVPIRKPERRMLGTIAFCERKGNRYKKAKPPLPGAWWEVECEPHVMMRLKRTFGRADKRQFGKLHLRNTDEVCRDLQWFLGRYPLEVEESKYLEWRSTEHEQQAVEFENLLSGAVDPRTFDLAIPARQYQQVAADLWLRAKGLLVADDLGLGKTLVGIAGLTKPELRPALVVTLTHLPMQWKREIEKFAPGLKTHIVKKGTPYDVTIPTGHRAKTGQGVLFEERFPDVLVINYHKLAGWGDVLAGRVRSCIFDECQELRIPTSAKYTAAKHIAESSSYALGLSATPVYNYGGEMYHIMQVLRRDALGTHGEFMREWCDGAGWQGDKSKVVNPKAFGTHLRETGLMIRRTRSDVGRELPAVTKVPHYINVDTKALDAVADSAAELAKIILSKNSAVLERGQAARDLDWKLRQATGISKAPYVAEFVKMLLESEDKIVLYGWHREVYTLWAERLKEYKPVFFTGTESPVQKERSRLEFCAGDAKILIMSLRAGAGLDGLQEHSRTVVFGELDWSPGVHDQCLSDDTEVLTPDGFRGVDDVSVGDIVAGYDLSSSSIDWVRAENKTDRRLMPGEKMYSVRTKKIDLCVTGEHRMVIRRKRRTAKGVSRSEWSMETAQNISGQSRRCVPLCGYERTRGVSLTSYELRLLGWFLSDGSYNGQVLTIYQAESQPWNADIVEVLDGCGLQWTLNQRENPSGTLNMYSVCRTTKRWRAGELGLLKHMRGTGATYADIGHALRRTSTAVMKKWHRLSRNIQTINSPPKAFGRGLERLEKYLDKNISPLLAGLTRDQLLYLIHGLFMGDGAKSSKNTYRITNTNKIMLDRLQSLCVRRGLSARISERSQTTIRGNKIYDIYISDSEDASLPNVQRSNALAQLPAKENTRVWCLSNRLGTLVVRRNGKVAIVGNCVGRLNRDGQADPVMAYYLLSDHGSDPIVADVLGIKKIQIEGIRDPKADLVEKLDTGPDRLKKLAAAYLKQRGRKPA